MTSEFYPADHLSYSSLSTYSSCPRSYYLSRHKRAWGLPAWYFIVGSAVHDYIKDELSPDSSPRPLEEYFQDEVNKANDLEEDQSLWLHGGSDDDPVVGEKALALASACVEKFHIFMEDMSDIWQVEYDVSGHLPGCSMEIKAYVDVVGMHKKHGPVIIDWKTGKTKPKDNIQLETYHCLEMVKAGTTLDGSQTKGLYVMLNPDAAKARPVTFKHTPESLGKLYGGIEQQIKSRVWKPEPQYNCRFCTMKPNCKTMSGRNDRTRYYDTPERDKGYPF